MEKLVVLVVAVEPGHHGAELFADLFEGMFRVLTTHSQEMSPAAGLVFEEPIFGKGPGLDIVEDVFHSLLRILGYDAGAGRIVTVFSRITDGFTHLGHAAFIHVPPIPRA